MKTIMADIKQLSNGSVAGIIQKFAGIYPGYNWVMKDGTLPQYTNGETHAVYDRTSKEVTTTFDSQKFQNASDLAVATTILHESVHAYLVAYFAVNPINATNNKDYKDMINEYYSLKASGSSSSLGDAHHFEMAQSFVTDIADALQEYGQMQNYNLSRQYYEDMAWSGLSGTKAFSQLSSTNQARIKNLSASEINGYKLNGTYVGLKGQKAGC